MSNETEEGVAEVKTAACDKLLQARVDARMAGKKVRRGARCRFCFGRVCKLGVVPCRVGAVACFYSFKVWSLAVFRVRLFF